MHERETHVEPRGSCEAVANHIVLLLRGQACEIGEVALRPPLTMSKRLHSQLDVQRRHVERELALHGERDRHLQARRIRLEVSGYLLVGALKYLVISRQKTRSSEVTHLLSLL